MNYWKLLDGMTFYFTRVFQPFRKGFAGPKVRMRRGVTFFALTILLLAGGPAHAQLDWTNTTQAGSTSTVVPGDTTTIGTGTDITAVTGDGTTLNITLTSGGSIGSSAGAVIVDGTAISNPASGTTDSTTTVTLDFGSSVTVGDSGSGAVGVELDGSGNVANSGTLEITSTGGDAGTAIQDIISSPASSTGTIEITNQADGTLMVMGGTGGDCRHRRGHTNTSVHRPHHDYQ